MSERKAGAKMPEDSPPLEDVDTGVAPDASVCQSETLIPTLMSASEACCGVLSDRLGEATFRAAARLTTDTSALINHLEQCASTFSSDIRRRQRAADKRLMSHIEELADVVKALESCLQMSFACVDHADVIADSIYTANHLLDGTDALLRVSSALTSPPSTVAVQLVGRMSRVQIGLDPVRCMSSHPQWLSRGGCTPVSVTVVDGEGDAVQGVTPMDVNVSVEGDAVGWSIGPVSVEGNTVVLMVDLTRECSDAASVGVTIGGSNLVLDLKASASPAAISAALDICSRVRAVKTTVAPDDIPSLVSACMSALSSTDVASYFLQTVASISYREYANRVTCGAAGVVPAVVAAISAHAADHVGIAVSGCEALGELGYESPPNSDAIVLSAGGLAAICGVMSSHPMNGKVQLVACWALRMLVRFVTSAALGVMRVSDVVRLVGSAKVNHAGERELQEWADMVLGRLSGE